MLDKLFSKIQEPDKHLPNTCAVLLTSCMRVERFGYYA